MSSLGSDERPLRVAVIGSGPSGFYAVEALFKSDINVRVDMFDRLPTPYGLVRAGVAPDHAKIKNVIKVYERIAADSRFEFFGNVCVGEDLILEEIREHYDAAIFAVGAETDKKLGIPGEDLPGSHTATEFVGWYNGHPDYRNRTFDLSSESAVVIGQGNVAMDVARILSKTIDELRNTDIAKHALEALAESRVRNIHLVGRRGPVQAAFTQPEIKEFGELADCVPVFHHPDDMTLTPASQQELDDPQNNHARKNYEVLQTFLKLPPSKVSKKFIIHFYQSPKELVGEKKVEKVVFERNELSGEAGRQKARGTGAFDELECGLFFRSVGYRGVPIPGLPFDEQKGIIPNKLGRIICDKDDFAGMYVTGWIKRGPSGVIGTNKPDSVETVKSLLEDLPNLHLCPHPDTEGVRNCLRHKKVHYVSYDDWLKIDAAEIERGKSSGKPREKFTHISEMLTLLDQ